MNNDECFGATRWLLETFNLGSGSRVLDVAGGKGELSAELAHHGVECTMIDPNRRSREPRRRRTTRPAPTGEMTLDGGGTFCINRMMNVCISNDECLYFECCIFVLK